MSQQLHNPNISYDRLEAGKYADRLLRNKYFILASVVVAILFAFVYLYFKQPLYRIQAAVVIKDEKKGETSKALIEELDFLGEQKIVDNEAEILKSENIISKVVDKLSLHIAYYENDGVIYRPIFQNIPFTVIPASNTESITDPIILTTGNNVFTIGNNRKLYNYGDTISIQEARLIFKRSETGNPATGTMFKIKISDKEEVAQNIKREIAILPPSKNSSILNISMLHPSRRRGAEILREIIDQYNTENVAEKQKQTDTILKLIESRLSLIAQQLENFGQQEQSYKSSRKITQLSDDSKMFLENVSDNDEQIMQASNKLLLVTDLEKHVVNSGEATVPSIPAIDPSLATSINQLNQLELEKKQLETTTGEQNILLQVKKQQIGESRATILKNLQIQKKNLESTLTELNSRKKNIEKNISSIPVSERNLLEIMREKNIRENIYTYLLQKREEASINDVSLFQKMKIIDQPYSSTKPVAPKKLVVFGGAIFLGFLFPVILISTRKDKGSKIKFGDERLNINDLPVAGTISYAGKLISTVFNQQTEIVAEQFRQLRTFIIRNAENRNQQVFLITSSIPGEGKSFISLNLSACFAMLGKRILLIDGDLRNSGIKKSLGFAENKGLASLLSDNGSEISDHIFRHPDYDLLDILPASGCGQNASELLGKDLNSLFSSLRKEYDFIFVNTPPTSLFSDAEQLDKYSDACLFVIRHNYTGYSSLSIKKFGNIHIVYNNVPLNQVYNKKLIKGKNFRYYNERRVLA